VQIKLSWSCILRSSIFRQMWSPVFRSFIFHLLTSNKAELVLHFPVLREIFRLQANSTYIMPRQNPVTSPKASNFPTIQLPCLSRQQRQHLQYQVWALVMAIVSLTMRSIIRDQQLSTIIPQTVTWEMCAICQTDR